MRFLGERNRKPDKRRAVLRVRECSPASTLEDVRPKSSSNLTTKLGKSAKESPEIA